MKYLLLLFVTVDASYAATTYTKDARPIFVKRCSQCHNDMWPDKNWLEYSAAFDNRDQIKRRLIQGTMPLGSSMPKEEKDTVIKWVDEGGMK